MKCALCLQETDDFARWYVQTDIDVHEWFPLCRATCYVKFKAGRLKAKARQRAAS